MDLEFNIIKSAPNTRVLAKKSAINSILKIYDAAHTNFTSAQSKKVPLLVKKNFNDPLHKFYLYLIRDTCELFEDSIKMIEGDVISAFEGVRIVKFIPIQTQTTLIVFSLFHYII